MEASIASKYCRACRQTKALSRFRYIRYFQEYRSICKQCEADQKRKRGAEREKRQALIRTQRNEAREALGYQKNAEIVGKILGLTEVQRDFSQDAESELQNLTKTYRKNVLRYFMKRWWLGIGLALAALWIFQTQAFVWLLVSLFIITICSVAAAWVAYNEFRQVVTSYTQKCIATLREKETVQNENSIFRQLLLEKGRGFDVFIQGLNAYDEKKDEFLIRYLELKERPSPKAAEVLRQETKRRRDAETNYFQAKSVIDYYESIAPFLIDLKDDFFEGDDDNNRRDFDSGEQQDAVTDYVTKDEYRKLSSAERNQLALDRFWRRPKSKRLLGRIYERYVGYLYENEGYDVEYVGIFKGFEDLGRDLICRKDDEIIIIQCKHWSQFKTIYEKHIFQFFGTIFQYKQEQPRSKVKGTFYTSTQLSPLARQFGESFGIEIKEGFKFDDTYPSIKCNLSRIDGAKIYHLPFDQQYDKVKVETNRGELYCSSAQDAESQGFRRAFKWRPTS